MKFDNESVTMKRGKTNTSKVLKDEKSGREPKRFSHRKRNLKLGGGRLLMRKTNNSNMAHISKVKKMLSFKNTIL